MNPIISGQFWPTIRLLGVISLLSACGGGGGGGTGTPPPAAVTTFQTMVPAVNFNWSTARQAPASITLSRSTGLGPLTLFISNYACVDLNDNLTPLDIPMSLDLFTSYALGTSEQALTSLNIDLGSLPLQLPAVNKYVLVEVVSGYQSLYRQLLTPTELGVLNLTLPTSSAEPGLCKT